MPEIFPRSPAAWNASYASRRYGSERTAAELAVTYLTGVRNVTDDIDISTDAGDGEERRHHALRSGSLRRRAGRGGSNDRRPHRCPQRHERYPDP
jgi:hypothetical protein